MARYHPTGAMAIRFQTAVLATPLVPPALPVIAVADANTGSVNLSPYAMRDGITTPSSGNTIDASDISSLFNSTAPGTYGGDAMELVFHRDFKVALDVAWTALPRGASGVIIIARAGFATTTATVLGTPSASAAVGDRIETYPVTVISREMQKTGDETSRFVVKLAITSPPADNASVVA